MAERTAMPADLRKTRTENAMQRRVYGMQRRFACIFAGDTVQYGQK